MWWRQSNGSNLPHTFLVVDTNQYDRLYVIESNVVPPRGTTVGTRRIMFAELRQTLTYWSVYFVS
jgi:hypothetical protein